MEKRPDWGNTARAATAELGSIGLNAKTLKLCFPTFAHFS